MTEAEKAATEYVKGMMNGGLTAKWGFLAGVAWLAKEIDANIPNIHRGPNPVMIHPEPLLAMIRELSGQTCEDSTRCKHGVHGEDCYTCYPCACDNGEPCAKHAGEGNRNGE